MGKLLTKKLLENGQGRYVAQLGLTYDDLKILNKLVEQELKRCRATGDKGADYQRTAILKGTFQNAISHLKYAFQKRQEGRYKSTHTSTPNKPEGLK